MRFTPTAVAGAFIIDYEPVIDDRGSFARTYCAAEFARAGIDFTVVQTNISRNSARHTLRGLHFQVAPHAEAKLVQCVRGAIFDVAVDLRAGSPTRGASAGVELAATGDRALFIPAGCAHGFLTLTPDSDLTYAMGTAFVAGSGSGVRWDDASFGIDWPAMPAVISPRDAAYPDFAGDWQPVALR